MRLTIQLVNEDTIYNERLRRYAEKNLMEEFVILSGEENCGVHITLISESMYQPARIARGSFPVILCQVDGVDRIEDCPAVYRYQPADELLHTVRRIFLEQKRYETAMRKTGETCTTALFLSPAGGVGTSTLAMSLAIHAAQTGQRVILLDLTQFSGLGAMIRPVEQCLSEVIFSLKMKKNLTIRLSEQLREDVSGFRYFGITERLHDMSELTAEDVRLLIKTLKEGGFCDLLVIDGDCRLDAVCGELERTSDQIYIVSDGREMANLKVTRYAVALQRELTDVLERTVLVYNGSGGKEGAESEIPLLRELGRFPRIREASSREIAEQFSLSELWGQETTKGQGVLAS